MLAHFLVISIFIFTFLVFVFVIFIIFISIFLVAFALLLSECFKSISAFKIMLQFLFGQHTDQYKDNQY